MILSILYVLPVNRDEIVAIRAGLFMIESQRMTYRRRGKMVNMVHYCLDTLRGKSCVTFQRHLHLVTAITLRNPIWFKVVSLVIVNSSA